MMTRPGNITISTSEHGNDGKCVRIEMREGGGICGLDNYRTLCVQCHRHETARLAGRRAVYRRKSAGIPEQMTIA